MPWFAVRCFYRTTLKGRASRRDSGYRAGLAAIEERIVLFKAATAGAACKRARAEATAYTRRFWKNSYSQTIAMRRLAFIEAFELFDPPGDGREMFSRIQTIPVHERPNATLARVLGQTASPDTARMFIAADVADALEVVV